MPTMPLHFSKDKYSYPREAVYDRLRERGHDGLMIFRQESLYRLTDTTRSAMCLFRVWC